MERRLGLSGIVAISLGAMLGSLFILPGLSAKVSGPSMWLAFLIAGICCLPATLSKSELATAMPTSGGSYVYIDRTFGPLMGTIGGLGLWLAQLLKTAFALVGLSWYLQEVWYVPTIPAALFFLVAVTGINIVGVRKVGQAQVVLVSLSILGLAVLIFAGVGSIDTELLTPSLPRGTVGLIECVAVVYISYAGVTKIAAIAEEVERPDRNLPLGMIISLAVATLIYTIFNYVLAGTVDTNLSMAEGGLQGDFRPVHTMAVALGGDVLGKVFAVLGTLTMVSMANAGLLAASRFPFSMARDRLLPGVLGEVRSSYLTPIPAIVMTSLIMGVAIIYLDVYRLAKLASSFKILAFMAVNLAVIVLRETHVRWYQPSYRTPLYPWVQVIGILMGVVLLFLLGLMAAVAALGIIAGGACFWFLYGRRQMTERKGAVGRLGPGELIAGTTTPVSTFDGLTSGDVGALVTLVDRSPPEPLIELGAALADRKDLAVIRVREVPEQLGIEDLSDSHPAERALRRRSVSMGAKVGARLFYETGSCRDLREEVYELCHVMKPRWVLFEWREQNHYAVWHRDPLAWLFSHLPANVAVFKDDGVRVFNSILVVAELGDHDLVLARTADLLADTTGGKIRFVATVPEGKATEDAEHHLSDLANLCQSEAEVEVICTDEGIDHLEDLSADFDLLLLEEPPYEHFYSKFMRRMTDQLTERARCSVLRIRIPEESLQIEEDDGGSLHGEELLVSFLDPQLCLLDSEALSKKQVIRAIANRFVETYGGSRSDLEEAFWYRERQQSTHLGDGICLPHATLAEREQTSLGVVRLKTPIELPGSSGEKVDLFLFTVGPGPDHHVHEALIDALRLEISETQLGSRLRQAKDIAEIRRIFQECAQLIEHRA